MRRKARSVSPLQWGRLVEGCNLEHTSSTRHTEGLNSRTRPHRAAGEMGAEWGKRRWQGGGGCHRRVILTVPKSHISKHASDHVQLEAAALCVSLMSRGEVRVHKAARGNRPSHSTSFHGEKVTLRGLTPLCLSTCRLPNPTPAKQFSAYAATDQVSTFANKKIVEDT